MHFAAQTWVFFTILYASLLANYNIQIEYSWKISWPYDVFHPVAKWVGDDMKTNNHVRGRLGMWEYENDWESPSVSRYFLCNRSPFQICPSSLIFKEIVLGLRVWEFRFRYGGSVTYEEASIEAPHNILEIWLLMDTDCRFYLFF